MPPKKTNSGASKKTEIKKKEKVIEVNIEDREFYTEILPILFFVAPNAKKLIHSNSCLVLRQFCEFGTILIPNIMDFQ